MGNEQVNKGNNINISNYVYYEDDEIDLYELWLTLKKRWKTVFFTTLAFLLIAVMYLLLAHPIFTSKSVIKIPPNISGRNLVSPKESIEYINYLDNLRKEENFDKLAKLLYISIKDVKDLASIRANSNRSDKSLVMVEIEVYNPVIIKQISDGLLKYLNQNPYVQEKISLQKNLLKKQINEIKSKLKDLYSLRKSVISKIKNGDIKDLRFNPIGVDTSIINLKNRLTSLEMSLKNIKGFEVSVPPFIPEKPSKPKKGLIVAVSIVSGLFLGVFLAFFLEWLENVRKRHQENIN